MPESFDLDDYDPIGPPPTAQPEPPPPTPLPSRRNPAATGNAGQPSTSEQPPTGAIPRIPTGGVGRTPPPPTTRSQTGSVGQPPQGPPSRVAPRTGRVGVPGQSGDPSNTQVPPTVAGRTNVSGPRTQSPTQVGVPPHTKASDLLRGHANYKASETRDNKPRMPFLTEERSPTRADDFFTGVFWLAVGVAACCLVYYLWGLFSGSLSAEAFNKLGGDDQKRIYTNLALGHTVLEYSLLVLVGTMLFLFYDEGAAGYGLVLGAVFLQVVLPLIGSQYFALARTAEGAGARQLYKDAAEVAWIPGIPGILLIVMDLIRKFITGLEEARFKRKNLQYGQGVVKQAKARNIFLGYCWDMPFCRPEIKVKCPIFLRKRGPCWRTKRGCMCDETIVLNANADNWKAKVSAAQDQLEGGSGKAKAKPVPIASAHQQLSPAFKRERCRQCVIYNTHQEQKYKAMVAATFVLCGVAFYMFSPQFLTTVETGYKQFDKVAAHLSFSASNAAVKKATIPDGRPKATTSEEAMGEGTDLSEPTAWVVLIIVSIVLLSKFLNLIEYCCFKLKI